MSSVYSTQFLAIQGLEGTATIELPHTQVPVLRCLDIWNGAGGTSQAFLRGAHDQAIWAKHWLIGDGPSHEQWQGRQVCQPGDVLTVTCTQPMDVTLSGYLLALP